METLIAWMLSVMLSIAPHYTSYIPEAQETPEQMQDRYEDIATDILNVVYDPNETPLYNNPRGREQSAATMLAIAYYESSFRKNVDMNIGKDARGDHGRSWCIMQINIGEGTTEDGWTGPELIADRIKCIKTAYKYIKRSFGACRGLPAVDRLSAYASGKCYTPSTPSRRRLNLASYWFQKSPNIPDSVILRSFKQNQNTTEEPLSLR